MSGRCLSGAGQTRDRSASSRRRPGGPDTKRSRKVRASAADRSPAPLAAGGLGAVPAADPPADVARKLVANPRLPSLSKRSGATSTDERPAPPFKRQSGSAPGESIAVRAPATRWAGPAPLNRGTPGGVRSRSLDGPAPAAPRAKRPRVMRTKRQLNTMVLNPVAATETSSGRHLMFSAGLRLGGRYGPRSGSRAVPEPNGHHGRTP